MIEESKRDPSMDPVFRILARIDHLVGDLKSDAWLPKDSEVLTNTSLYGSNTESKFFWPKRISNLDGTVFDCDGRRMQVTDYPYIKENWPIMSRKMLDILLAVGDFPHQVIPVVMRNVFDDPPIEEFHNFVAVQLLEHLDAFDWDKSVYTLKKGRSGITYASSVKKLVLREPEGGFPPLFRIDQVETRLFVSRNAKIALEAANIQGIDLRDKDRKILNL